MHVENLTLAYDAAAPVVDDLTLEVPAGQLTAVVGPNGSGKSTLLRGMSRLLVPRSGQVLLDGKDIHQLPARELARRLGVLPQGPVTPEGITAAELVSRGRHPHRGLFGRLTAEDDAAIEEALRAVELTELRDRPVDQLSGGQRQRVWIAMALAQETDILLLDEPTTFLDLTHQFEVLDLLVDLNRSDDRTIVLVLHDLNQACRFGDHLIAMKDGAIVAEGNPSDVITEAVVQDVFGLAVKVVPDPVAGTPMVVPIGRHTTRQETPANTPAPANAAGATNPAGLAHAAGPANAAAAALAASAAADGVCRPADR